MKLPLHELQCPWCKRPLSEPPHEYTGYAMSCDDYDETRNEWYSVNIFTGCDPQCAECKQHCFGEYDTERRCQHEPWGVHTLTLKCYLCGSERADLGSFTGVVQQDATLAAACVDTEECAKESKRKQGPPPKRADLERLLWLPNRT